MWLRSVIRSARQWEAPTGKEIGRIRNSLVDRKKVPLIVPMNRRFTWYSCGPTVYDVAHVGHARNYVSFDVIRRVLEGAFDVEIAQVMNITDIDDKILQRAAAKDVSWRNVARFYEQDFMLDMRSLGIADPEAWTRVSDFIPEIIVFIEKILRNGFGYVGSDGAVYFDVAKFGTRYRTSLVDSSQQESGAGKRGAADFVLWKVNQPADASWDSPWGRGRPGWHIECSAMATETLGATVDLHTGGIDLCFPHHVNEMAQSEAALGVGQWVSYLVHAGHVHIEGRKMSKSLKNFVSIKDMLGVYSSSQFRLFCLLHPYSEPVTYSDEGMRESVVLDKRIRECLQAAATFQHAAREPTANVRMWGAAEHSLLAAASQTRAGCLELLRDDFNTAAAVRLIMELLATVDVYVRSQTPSVLAVGSLSAALRTVHELFCWFGLLDYSFSAGVRSASGSDVDYRRLADLLVRFRAELRQLALGSGETGRPLLELCDRVRRDALVEGLSIEDRKGGAAWRRT